MPDGALGAVTEDGDCDGTPTDDDCDDDDPDSTIKANDGDCDGTPKDEDCNDGDELLNGDDGDEDGYSTCDGDCDDDDARRNPGGTDGLLRDGDCNDSFAGPSLAHADISLLGEKANDYAGHSLSSAGDVDGDGLDDVLVGTY